MREKKHRLVVESAPKTILYLKSSYFMSMKIYNKLPTEIKKN